MASGVRGGGRGGGNNYGGNNNGGPNKGGGCPMLHGRHDRFCVYCGGEIEQQNIRKSVVCPHPNCRKGLMFRNGFASRSGFGRCASCDCFIHVTHFFCTMCGMKNEEAFRRRNEAEKRKAEEALAEKSAENWLLKKRIQELEKAAGANKRVVVSNDNEPGGKKKKSTEEGDGEEKSTQGDDSIENAEDLEKKKVADKEANADISDQINSQFSDEESVPE